MGSTMDNVPIITIEGVVRRVLQDREGRRRSYYFGTIMSDRIKEITFVPVLRSPSVPI